jgi:hypothetical protein
VCPARPKRAPSPQNTAYSRPTMSQNHRPVAAEQPACGLDRFVGEVSGGPFCLPRRLLDQAKVGFPLSDRFSDGLFVDSLVSSRAEERVKSFGVCLAFKTISDDRLASLVEGTKRSNATMRLSKKANEWIKKHGFYRNNIVLEDDNRNAGIYDPNTHSIRLLPTFCAGRARLPTNRSRALNTALTQRNALPSSLKIDCGGRLQNTLVPLIKF